MGEMAQYINRKGTFSTAILKYPTGRFGIVGSVPFELTVSVPNSITLGARKSMAWDTEDEAIKALLAIGLTRFQLSNCKYYEA